MYQDSRKFSILIPSWNNLAYLKICVDSIRRNSTYPHQIIIHVNEGSDGTLEWVMEQGLDYTYSEQNVGVCIAMNMMRTKVQTDYILFVNDDMYVLPGWDEVLVREIDSLPDNKFYLSSTTIQPHTYMKNGILADFGDTPETFQEERLLKEYQSYELADWFGSTLPPCIVHRDLWDIVGGYSIEYTPGMYSDPDFTAKLWMCGVRYMKGLSASRIYHFETKSTGRVKRNDGNTQFLLKWGVTSSTFRKYITRRGESYDPAKALDIPSCGISKWKMQVRRSRLKAIWQLVRHGFGVLYKFVQ